MTPGASYAYSYDDAGNRTGVWLNGTRTITQSFNAANQVNGFTYDAAGNLTNDGSTTYTYDALGRMTIRNTTPYTYNGDGVLVYDGTTRYTQDLAAPLSQILQTVQGSTTTSYLYGLERLASLSGIVKSWYGVDGLGSVRQTLSEAGTPLSVVNYDPWGIPESGTVPTFGFTGELQNAATGLVNLRARWYSTNQGKFTTFRWRTSESSDTTPYSHHPYAYALSNPVLYTDPTGKCVPYIDPTCRPFWEEGVTYTGWDDFQQYSAGVVEGMGAPGAALANFTKQETWDAAGRGVNNLLSDPTGSASYLGEKLVDPVVRGAQLVTSDPARAVQILNDNPREVGQLLGGTAGTAIGARSYLKARAAVAQQVPARAPLTAKSPAYLEYKALRLQGYSASEAFSLMKQFRAGVNPGGKFAFHFTSVKGGSGIISSGHLRHSSRGLRGPGVYAGTTPTPSWLLKHVPYIGWGLVRTPVRIPILICQDMVVRSVKWPLKTVIFDTKGNPLPLSPQGE